MADKIIGKIYETMDYDRFKFLEENREVKASRVKKIKDSIEEVGYVLQPILVNENMEIIDGQGRFNACVDLGLPIIYMIEKGRGIKECRQLNLGQENWTTWNWINSYADGGNVDYQRFRTFLNNSKVSISYLLPLPFDMCIPNGTVRRRIKEGDLHFSKETHERVKWQADYLERFIPIIKNMRGRKAFFYGALAYAYKNLNTVQRNRLFDVIKKNALISEMYGTVAQNLMAFDNAYNKGQRKENRINLEFLYRNDCV